MGELIEIARRAATVPQVTLDSRDVVRQDRVKAIPSVGNGSQELSSVVSRPSQARELSPLDILSYLRSGGVPVPHCRIIKEMMMRGFPKEACRKMVQYLQQSHQIEHDLKGGYVLCEELAR